MPRRTRAQQRADEIDVSPTTLLAEIERLRAELEATQAEASEYLAGLQRERAEFQNFRRRTAEERERDAGLAGRRAASARSSPWPTTSTGPSRPDRRRWPAIRGSTG